MNTFDAKLKKGANGYSVELCGKDFPLGAYANEVLAKKGATEQDIVLGVRPEHIELTEGDGVKAKVTISEMMGSEMHVHAEAGGKSLIIRVPMIGLSANLAKAIEEGGEVSFTFKPEVMHIFEKKVPEEKDTSRNLVY